MSDYINKAEAIDKIHWGINDEAFFGEPEIDQKVMEFLRSFPNADVRENIHGEWIFLDECSNSGYYCSICHKKLVKEGWSDTVKKINFCPNCGADMRGDKE